MVLAGGEADKTLATASRIVDELVELEVQPERHRDRPRRRGGGRRRGFRGRDLPSRHPLPPGADDLARPGRLLGRRQDRGQPPEGKEPHRRVSPARVRRRGHRSPRDIERTRASRWSRGGHQVRRAVGRGVLSCGSKRTSTGSSPATRSGSWPMRCGARAQIKAEVVSQDEREAGVRARLNLGHTFGHAIEAGMEYGRWLHGEAVAAGICMAADLAVADGVAFPAQDCGASPGARSGAPAFPDRGPAAPRGRIPSFGLMGRDKKVVDGGHSPRAAARHRCDRAHRLLRRAERSRTPSKPVPRRDRAALLRLTPPVALSGDAVLARAAGARASGGCDVRRAVTGARRGARRGRDVGRRSAGG